VSIQANLECDADTAPDEAVGVALVGGHLAAVVWASDAACAGQYELYDTAAALPVLASVRRVTLRGRALDAARAICGTCPVLRRCEEASATESDGFWAGMTEEERDTRWSAVRGGLEHAAAGRDEAIVAAYRSGASVAAIGATFGCTRDVIGNRLAKAGISPGDDRAARLVVGAGR